MKKLILFISAVLLFFVIPILIKIDNIDSRLKAIEDSPVLLRGSYTFAEVLTTNNPPTKERVFFFVISNRVSVFSIPAMPQVINDKKN